MISPNITFPSGQWNYPAGSARYNWTASTIDDARADGIPWVVVGMHKPCLSLGEYNCDVGADLVNMLLAKRVDLVLSGHEHLYQRTKQLGLRSGCPALTIGSYNPSCVVDADDTMVKGAGTVFATVGTGGNALRDIDTADPEAPYFAATNGSNQNPTYGFGDFDVTPDVLTMRFARGVGGTFADTVTMTRGTGANGNPVASFTSSSSQLTASFDASGSGDPDGTIAGYAWDFGDGTTGQGVSPQHAYTAAGSYPVKLTVTDDAGATDTLTRSVTVTAPPPASVVASDGFDRNLTGSWGRADAGGDWSLRGTTARFTVASSAGRIQVPAGSTLYADLNQVGTTSVRLTADFSVDRLSEGTYISLVGRQIGTETYVTRLRLQADGKSKLYLLRGSGTALGTVVSPDTTFVPGEHYLLSMEVKGVSPTTVSVKVWKLGDPEPTAWARTVTDSFAALQAPGRIGVFSYLPSTTTNGPVTLSFHQLTANDAG
jgi:PKD repeat protein